MCSARHVFTCLSRGDGNTGLMSKQVRIKTGRYRGYRGRVLWVGENEVSIAPILTSACSRDFCYKHRSLTNPDYESRPTRYPLLLKYSNDFGSGPQIKVALSGREHAVTVKINDVALPDNTKSRYKVTAHNVPATPCE